MLHYFHIEAGKEIEDFINSNTIKLIYNQKDPHTFMHYSGSLTTPDLLLVSSGTVGDITRTVLEDQALDTVWSLQP
ncbi:hypothetical protein CEXT_494451 [Caerostris extrusa]|uniref:Uncharacterized protein n=1 Tax=Caerostris extrusa TaxID=172846 RepID=A0AAV4RJG3_CAEEX|nr:hypothetical protein CEXT_494451 [Caerostris extrusa]